MGPLQVSELLLLLLNPVLVNLAFFDGLLKALLDDFELLISIIEVIAHLPGIDLLLRMLSLHLEDRLAPLAELQLELLYLVLQILDIRRLLRQLFALPGKVIPHLAQLALHLLSFVPCAASLRLHPV